MIRVYLAGVVIVAVGLAVCALGGWVVGVAVTRRR